MRELFDSFGQLKRRPLKSNTQQAVERLWKSYVENLGISSLKTFDGNGTNGNSISTVSRGLPVSWKAGSGVLIKIINQ
jgi:hypothetical protein